MRSWSIPVFRGWGDEKEAANDIEKLSLSRQEEN